MTRRYDPTSPESRFLRAQFIRNHPRIALGKVHAEGRAARANGTPLTACPYVGRTREEWEIGWRGLPSQWAKQREVA